MIILQIILLALIISNLFINQYSLLKLVFSGLELVLSFTLVIYGFFPIDFTTIVCYGVIFIFSIFKIKAWFNRIKELEEALEDLKR